MDKIIDIQKQGEIKMENKDNIERFENFYFKEENMKSVEKIDEEDIKELNEEEEKEAEGGKVATSYNGFWYTTGKRQFCSIRFERYTNILWSNIKSARIS